MDEEDELQELLEHLYRDLLANSKSLGEIDPEAAKILYENLWDLYL